MPYLLIFSEKLLPHLKIENDNTLATTKSTNGINAGQYITIIYNDGVTRL